MPAAIQFRRGEKQSFIATRSFSLGTGVNIQKGQEVLFDGATANVDGDDFAAPNLRGALKAGWLILAENFDAMDDTAERPVSANIQVHHPTQGGNPMDLRSRTNGRTSMTTTESDEREVGSVQTHAQRARTANQGYRRGQPVNVGMVESQDGVPVRTLKTPAGGRAMQQRTVLTAGSVGQAMRDTEVTIDAGRGMTQEEMLERMTPDDRDAYLAEKAGLKAQYVDEPARVVGRVASKKATEQKDGFTTKLSTGGGIETADLSGMDTGKAVQATMVVEGMTFQTTNGPKQGVQQHPRQEETKVSRPVLVEASADIRRKVAKTLCPDFPDNYRFELDPKKKLARLQADYEDRLDVLQAVFAAEGDEFKAILVREFPQAFA